MLPFPVSSQLAVISKNDGSVRNSTNYEEMYLTIAPLVSLPRPVPSRFYCMLDPSRETTFPQFFPNPILVVPPNRSSQGHHLIPRLLHVSPTLRVTCYATSAARRTDGSARQSNRRYQRIGTRTEVAYLDDAIALAIDNISYVDNIIRLFPNAFTS